MYLVVIILFFIYNSPKSKSVKVNHEIIQVARVENQSKYLKVWLHTYLKSSHQLLGSTSY